MCYSVYISTDSAEDLARHNTDLVWFEKVSDPESDPCISLLDFPHQWYVGSKSICSCTFRHLHSSAVDLGFGGPEVWYPEEQDEIDATLQLYSVLTSLLSSQHKVDLVDRWEGTQPDAVSTLDVSLNEVSKESFRMFEDHKFKLMMQKTPKDV